VLNTILPPGCRAVLVGSASSLKELEVFAPLEQGQEEDSRMLAQLTFEHRPPEFDYLAAELNQKCLETGVSLWPERQDIAFADPSQPVIYVCWQKGLVWWGWILALLGSLILPPLIMAGLWLILPESVRQMLEAVINLSIMGIVMFVMMKMTAGVTATGEEK
jgi:hypothetical protein